MERSQMEAAGGTWAILGKGESVIRSAVEEGDSHTAMEGGGESWSPG